MNLAFIYFELLFFSHLSLVIFAAIGREKDATSVIDPFDAPAWLGLETAAWAKSLIALLAPYKVLRETLQSDLNTLGWPDLHMLGGRPELQGQGVDGHKTAGHRTAEQENDRQGLPGDCEEYWTEFARVFNPLAGPGGVFDRLNQNEIKLIVQEDKNLTRNFSFYRTL